jgi:cobalt-zinc-cadmium efflux system outer membrane protein
MTPLFRLFPWARYLPLVVSLLAGCTNLDTRIARESVRQSIGQKSGLDIDVAARSSRQKATAISVMSADEGVRLALGDNPRVDAILAELDAAEAQALQASLLKNPFLHASLLFPNDSQGKAIDIGLSWDVLGLLTLGPRREAADQARAAARLKAVAGILELAARSRTAWFTHMADREGAAMLAGQAEAAELSAEIAQRLEQAGNLPPLASSVAQAARLDARFALEDAEMASRTSLERLAALLGVNDPARLALPENLPRLPAVDPAAPDLSILESVDLQLAALRADLARVRQQGESARRAGWTDALELGWTWDRETSGEWKDGPSLGLSVPLFDTGEARRAAARFEADQLEARIAERKLAVTREAREASNRMLRARARVEHLRENLLPLLSDAQDQALLQYNAMQKSSFHLIDLKQQELAAIRQLVVGLADYWQARTTLEALKMGVSLDTSPRAGTVAVTAQPASQSGGH